MKAGAKLVLYTTCLETGFDVAPKVATFEVTLPKFLVAEFNTHRMLSRNSASSRAIPVKSMCEYGSEHMFMPEKWLENQSGMAAKTTEISPLKKAIAKCVWVMTANICKASAKILLKLGLHKQWSNRMLEWFSYTTIIATATDWNNFVWLRNDVAAQPEIANVASDIDRILRYTQPQVLPLSAWHMPYVYSTIADDGVQVFKDNMPLEHALRISASVCAQISYRKADDSLEKANDIHNKLFGGERIHASPVEHQAQYVHKDMLDQNLTGNFTNVLQHRKLISNECKWG